MAAMRYRWLWEGCALAVIALAVRAATSGRIGTPVLLLYAAIGLALAAIALRGPMLATAVGIAVIAAMPIYWGRPILLSLASSPGQVVPLMLLPAAWRVGRQAVQFTVIDKVMATLVAALVLAFALNFSGPLVATLDLIVHAVVPYAVARLLAHHRRFLSVTTSALVVVAVPLAIIGLAESRGIANPFFTLVRPVYEAQAWARPQLRFGDVRAEASFGHSIAFGMFLAFVIVLALARISSSMGRQRIVLSAVMGLLGLALLATLSRGPLAVAAVGTVAWLVTMMRSFKPHQVFAAALTGACLLVLTPAGSVIAELQGSLGGSGEEARTVEHRITINGYITDPRFFSFFGPKAEGQKDVRGAAEDLTGLNTLQSSIDSEYSALFLASGLIPLVAFVALGSSVWASLRYRWLTALERAWIAATAAAFFGLFGVALITQYKTIFWFAVGVTSTLVTRARTRRDDLWIRQANVLS